MANFKNLIGFVFKNILYFALGLCFLSIVVAYSVVTIPVFLYRWIVTKIVAPRWGGNLGKAVNTNGNMLVADFLKPEVPPRCSVVVNLVLRGNISYEQFYELIKQNWVKAVDDKGELKYPEFKQYLNIWMGFLFWKKDYKFDLNNHVKLHTLPEDGCDTKSEKFFCDLVENLINKPYPPKQSPWEIHLIQNYKNTALLTEKGRNPNDELSVFVFRIHHAMADGFSIMHLLAEALFEHNLETAGIAKPSVPSVNKGLTLKSVVTKIMYPLKVFREAGHLVALAVNKPNPFYIPDEKKAWHQLYGRAKMIPVHKIKTIKNNLGVSFVSVLNASIAGALSRIWADLEGSTKNIPKNLLFANAIPTVYHPKKLRNNVLGIAFNLAVGANLSPLQRLKLCEEYVQEVKTSPMPMLTGVGQKLFGGNLTRVAKVILRNRYLTTASSIFPGPSTEHSWDGMTALTIDYTAGCLNGVAGIGFMALSYAGYVQICIAAENAVLSREQLSQLIKYINEEVETLYKLATETNSQTLQSGFIV